MSAAPEAFFHTKLCRAMGDEFTFSKVFILGATISISQICYISCFALGVRNLCIIFKDKERPRSLLMMLQYVFGQLTCVARVFSLAIISQLYFSIHKAQYCKLTFLEF